MKSFLITLFCVLVAIACEASVGETAIQIEARYGKPMKDAKPLMPATAAKVYQKGDLGYFVGFINDVAVYEIVQEVEDDGDFGEDQLSEKEIAASLKANETDGEWSETKDDTDRLRHWKSANGKLLATYDKKYKNLLIESAAFADQRKVLTPASAK